VLLAIGFIGFMTGIIYSSGHLIKPVQRACSPPYSPSSTTYGLSAVGVGWIVTGAMGICLKMSNLIFWTVLGIVMMSVSEGIAGMTVLLCHQMCVAGEILYVATFVSLSIGTVFCYMSTIEIAMRLFPERPGLAGGIFSVSAGVGNVVFSQIILLLRGMANHYQFNESIIFFCVGIVIIVISSVWTKVLSSNDEVQSFQSKGHQQVTLLKFLTCRSMAFVVVNFCGFVPILAIVMHQEPLMTALWNTKSPPLSTLSAILTSSYVSGRVFGLLASDKVGLKRLWLLILFLEAMIFLSLAVLITDGIQNTWRRCLAIGLLAAGTTVGAVVKVACGGLCYEIHDERQQVMALVLMVLTSGVSCIAGPLAIERCYTAFGSYKQFLYGAAGISFIGLIVLFLIQPIQSDLSSEETSSSTSDN
jgi:hypothetical protein